MRTLLIASLLAIFPVFTFNTVATAQYDTYYTSELYDHCMSEYDLELGFCVGYIAASYDLLIALGSVRNPGGVNREQVQKIFIKWVDDHPQDLHQSALTSVVQALVETFPPETKDEKQLTPEQEQAIDKFIDNLLDPQKKMKLNPNRQESYMRTLFTAGMILAFTGVSIAQDIEGYICLSEKTTGFYFEEKTNSWEEIFFQAQQKHLIIKIDGVWFFKDIVADYTHPGACEATDNGEVIMLTCNSLSHRLDFYSKTMKFISYSMGSYYLFDDGESASADDDKSIMLKRQTPYITIGTCTKL